MPRKTVSLVFGQLGRSDCLQVATKEIVAVESRVEVRCTFIARLAQDKAAPGAFRVPTLKMRLPATSVVSRGEGLQRSLSRISKLQAGHTEEKGQLYQEALSHINEKQEYMVREHEFNEGSRTRVRKMVLIAR